MPTGTLGSLGTTSWFGLCIDGQVLKGLVTQENRALCRAHSGKRHPGGPCGWMGRTETLNPCRTERGQHQVLYTMDHPFLLIIRHPASTSSPKLINSFLLLVLIDTQTIISLARLWAPKRQNTCLIHIKISRWALYSRSVQFSHVQLLATPWTTARQASLSITNSQSLPKIMSIESSMDGNAIQPSHPLLFPSPPVPSLSQHQGHFRWVSPSYQVA